MKTFAWMLVAVAAGGCATGLQVKDIGSVNSGPMQVQYVKLESPRARYPLLMIHGGALTGVSWDTKPDGKPGWQLFFLREGHDVYVADAAARARTTGKQAWEFFRIGPADSYEADAAKRLSHAGTQFPVQAFDELARQSPPDTAGSAAPAQEAYNALVQRICPCVILAHSQGAHFAFNAALAAPDKVKGIVAVEPLGAPNPSRVDVGTLRSTPHLFVWGDYLETQDLWRKIFPMVDLYRAGLRAAGVRADVLELPKLGIRGNSHLLMMDRNSEQIAGFVQRWLEDNELAR